MRDQPDFQQRQILLGDRLRALRQERKLTQEAAAAQIGLNPRHLQKLEVGEVNVTLFTLWRISRAYDVDIKDLFQSRSD